MDESVIGQIYADVIDGASSVCREEHQITGFKVVDVHAHANEKHLGRCSRQAWNEISQRVSNKSGAVKAVRSDSGTAVGRSDEILGTIEG